MTINGPGVTYFDPQALKIKPSPTNVYNFTTITIAYGSTLKFSEAVFHGPAYLLASGDVTINGIIDLTGDTSPGPTPTAAEQTLSFAGSGGYSGGIGGIHSDTSHQALIGNGPGGGAPGDINQPYAAGGQFSTNRFLVPLVGGSGGGGTNDNGQYGSQGGAGGGALLIASSTKITLDNQSKSTPAYIFARGGFGTRGCGGSGGAVRLMSNTIVGAGAYGIYVDPLGSQYCKTAAGNGLVRLEANTINYSLSAVYGPVVTSVPFALNLPTVPAPVITVSSVNGIAINANPFSFPDATINLSSAVPVVINATNVPITSAVSLYLLSDVQPNQNIPVILTGTNAVSTATVQVTFPPGGSRGFVKAIFQ